MVFSICNASPPMMFPSVSCSEKPITAVKTAEVVIKPVKLTPLWASSAKPTLI
jgi:hypothetical protein